jgi:osmoprotectant transport system substrate-binding protein/osmoprotectant transport system permease protein
VGTALALAVPVAVLIGVAVARRRRLAAATIGVAGVIFTIPSLALFGLFVVPLGIGTSPAVAALALYALLPVLRNTVVGLSEVPADVVEAARGMGMTEAQTLRRVRLPLALPVVVSGVRVAAVTAVGIATVAALVAAGGLGVSVFDGLQAGDRTKTLAATLTIVVLALGIDGALGSVERVLRRRGRHASGAGRRGWGPRRRRDEPPGEEPWGSGR